MIIRYLIFFKKNKILLYSLELAFKHSIFKVVQVILNDAEIFELCKASFKSV